VHNIILGIRNITIL